MFDSIELRMLNRQKVDNTWWCILNPSFHFGKNRLHYVHSGSPTIYCDEKPYVLEPGKLYFFPQNLSFRAELAKDMQYDHTAIDFIVFPPTNMSLPVEIDLDATPLLRPAFDILLKIAENSPMENYKHKSEYTPIFKTYLTSFLKLVNKVTPIETISNPFVIDVLNYIHENYQKEITLKELAERTNYQRQFFIRKFKQIMHVTPYKYIKDYRLNTAFHLLYQKKCSVTDVAQKVGYRDVVGFSRAFKKHFGIYPKDASRIDLP